MGNSAAKRVADMTSADNSNQHIADFISGDKTKQDSAALTVLHDLVARDMDAVNALIMQRMQSFVPLISQLAGYIIAAGGKRIRPLLTLAAAELCGYQGVRHHKLATCVEFIHTATLLHDDVVDESALRRGNASANEVFGNKSSVLVGDFLFSRAFELMVEDGSLDVLRILSKASSVIAEGEVLQLVTTNDVATTEQAYLDVISAKTAALFAAACEIGGVLVEQSDKAAALRDFGQNLGVAFQIADDVLDYSAERANLGKTIGDDFREGELTLPVVLAVARGDKTDQVFWQRVLGDLSQTDEDLAYAQSLLMKTNALCDSLEKARAYAEKAKQALHIFPESEMRSALEAVVDFTVSRKY